jgi:hypothetical protein
LTLELDPRRREAPAERVGDVVVPRDGEHGRAEPVQEAGCGFMLLAPAAMGEVAARDYEVGIEASDELAEGRVGGRLAKRIPRAEMQVGHVEDAC